MFFYGSRRVSSTQSNAVQWLLTVIHLCCQLTRRLATANWRFFPPQISWKSGGSSWRWWDLTFRVSWTPSGSKWRSWTFSLGLKMNTSGMQRWKKIISKRFVTAMMSPVDVSYWWVIFFSFLNYYYFFLIKKITIIIIMITTDGRLRPSDCGSEHLNIRTDLHYRDWNFRPSSWHYAYPKKKWKKKTNVRKMQPNYLLVPFVSSE